MKSVMLSTAAFAVLSAASVEGNCVKLPEGQLDRRLYEEVDRALKALGGAWNRRQRGHVFAEDPSDAFGELLQTGRFTNEKQAFGFFPTPAPIVALMVERAGIEPGMSVLDPSAGDGDILDGLPLGLDVVDACEIDSKHAERLERALDRFGPETSTGRFSLDFLTKFDVGIRYDRILMNPPFSGQADIDHVRRAHTYLAPRGRLVSVMAQSVRFRTNDKAKAFRAYVATHGGTFEDLLDGSFRPSGTDARTTLLVLPAAA